MNFDQYSQLAIRTANSDRLPDEISKLNNAALGLAGEGGEIADHIKKHIFQGHPLDRAKLLKEAGDVLWYVNLLASALDVPLDSVAAMNIQKLEDRYPGGVFTVAASVNRKADDE